MALEDDFKAALGSWASGVSVVCTRDAGMVYGLTVSSFSSLSLDPLLVLVCLANSNRMPEMIRRSGVFSVSLLAEGQESESTYFATRGREPVEAYEEVETVECRAVSAPVVAGAIAHVACRLHEAFVVGDHTIICGRVVEASADPAKEPLLYYRRSYRGLDG